MESNKLAYFANAIVRLSDFIDAKYSKITEIAVTDDLLISMVTGQSVVRCELHRDV